MGHIVIHDWMRTELNLKGNDLLVFAIIYGFSQDNESKFTGSLQYLADWCGATKQGIQKNLKNLLDAGLIEKHELTTNNIKMVGYTTQLYSMQLSCTNNTYISNNILNTNTSNISNTSLTRCSVQGTSFLGSAKKESKPNLYTKCVGLINEFTDDEDVRKLLVEFLNMTLDMHRESGKQFYTNNFKGKLNQLKEFPPKDWKDIISQSIDRGWLSFYELKRVDTVHGEVFSDTDKAKQDEFIDGLRKSKRRIEF